MSIETAPRLETQGIDPALIERRRRAIEVVQDALLTDRTSLAWQAFAACEGVGFEPFFPEQGGTTVNAKKLCEKCDVKTLCLLYAIANNEGFGLWGGKSTPERKKIRRRIKNLRDSK